MSYCSLRHLLECLGYFGVFLSWEARQFLLWLSAGDRQAEMFFLFISLIHSEASQLQTNRLRRTPPTHCWCSTSRWRLTWNVSGIFKSTKTKMNRNRDIVRVKRKNKHKTFSSFKKMKKMLQVPNKKLFILASSASCFQNCFEFRLQALTSMTAVTPFVPTAWWIPVRSHTHTHACKEL